MADITIATQTVQTLGNATRPQVHVVASYEQFTANAGAAITEGSPVRFDAAGKFIPALADVAANANVYGVAVKTVAAGMAVTAIRRGILNTGGLDAVAYGAPVYLSVTAGRLADAAPAAAGTTSLVIGRVVPGQNHNRGTTETPAHLLNVLL